jgi:arylsulfatase A-like enzyme
MICLAAFAVAADRPNLIVILADDLGVETIGAYGGESYQTPSLDRMAAQGLLFRDFHAQPLCTPSRVKLLTGQYNYRNYRAFMYLDPEQTTFAHLLQSAGYKTVVAGKWQLVDNGVESLLGAYPKQAGFDHHFLWQVRRDTRGKRYWGPTVTEDGERKTYPDSVFGPDLYNQYLLDFISANKGEPFLAFYPMVLPHDPFVVTPDQPGAAADTEKHEAMIEYMDKLVGRLLSHLEAEGLAERTLVLFAGDNGTSRKMSSVRDGHPVPGGKGLTTRRGTHVPFIAWWPGTIEPGASTNALANFNDVFPTLLEVAGVDSADLALDGLSLRELFTEPGMELGRSSLFIHYDPRWFAPSARFVFDARYKLYSDGRFYDMQTDPGEQNDLRDQIPPPAKRAYEALSIQLLAAGGPDVDGTGWVPPPYRK